ncbi:MAG: HTH domain-containing protein [Methanobacterium sp.]
MPPKRKEIPFEDVKILGLKTLIKKGWTQEQMAKYYGVSARTIKRRLDELEQKE